MYSNRAIGYPAVIRISVAFVSQMWTIDATESMNRF